MTSTETALTRSATTFARVTVALDLSAAADRATPVGSALARHAGVPLGLLVVGGPGLDPEINRLELRERARRLAPPPSLTVLADLDPVARLVEVANSEGSLLCLATHGRGVIATSMLGSVSRAVVEAARRPVVLVGPRVPASPASFDTIVVGFDPAASNGRLLDVVAAWAHALHAGVHLVAVEEPSHWLLFGREPVGPQLEILLGGVARRLRAGGLDVRSTVIRVGRPAPALADVAARDGRALLALSSWHPFGLPGVAIRAAHLAPAPVVIVPSSRAFGERTVR
jgi:nucleotide-binding universal stress UspA family protein